MQICAEKLVFFSEEFDPKMFLARVHGGTCAADLETGALALKTDFKGRTQQRKQLVKENFDCFVSCKNTIDGMLSLSVTEFVNYAIVRIFILALEVLVSLFPKSFNSHLNMWQVRSEKTYEFKTQQFLVLLL